MLGDYYIRIRIGIGRPAVKGDEANYVLHTFRDDEIKQLEPVLSKSIEAVITLINEGLEKAQQKTQINPQKKA